MLLDQIKWSLHCLLLMHLKIKTFPISNPSVKCRYCCNYLFTSALESSCLCLCILGLQQVLCNPWTRMCLRSVCMCRWDLVRKAVTVCLWVHNFLCLISISCKCGLYILLSGSFAAEVRSDIRLKLIQTSRHLQANVRYRKCSGVIHSMLNLNHFRCVILASWIRAPQSVNNHNLSCYVEKN